MKHHNNTDKLVEHLKANEQKIYRLVYSYVKNDADAKDIIQNAILKAFHRYDSLTKESYLSTWFYRILVNECLDFIKHKKHEYTQDIDDALQLAAKDHDDFLLTEELNQLMDQLDPITRMLRFFDGRQLEEIADILQMNLSTVKSRLYKGLKMMRIQMEEQDI